jgi:Flp pilus assembly protein TadD
MGAIQGVLLGFALADQRGKWLASACLAGLMIVVLAAATVGRPYVNRSGHAGQELAREGYLELESGHNERGVALLERAVRLNDSQADWWCNLGIAYQRLGRDDDAIRAYRRAAKLDPSSARRETLSDGIALSAYRKLAAGENEEAASLYREALDLDERNARHWFNLGIACEKLGRQEAATSAFEKALALEPNDERIQAALESSRRQTK